MSAFDRYMHGSYLALRPYLFSKLFLIMVALDTWLLMIGHAGRYGVAQFNVAHFVWLDAISPLPSPGLYVGVLLLTGLLALAIALLGVNAWGMATLFALYTYSWSMSMLDSYQHHYFVSLIMLCLVFFPHLTLRDVVDDHTLVGKRTRGFGYALLGLTITILYTFTSLAKADRQWCEGYTLQRISKAGEVFAPLASLAAKLGISAPTFWSLVSTSVIPTELWIAFAYAVAVRQDDAQSQWPRRIAKISLFIALSLHVGAELLRLEIGWFSYYMFVLALVFLTPGPWLERVCRPFVRAAFFVEKKLGEPVAADSSKLGFEAVLVSVCTSGVLAASSYLIDLPGAIPAAIWAIAGLFAVVLLARVRGRHAEARRTAFAFGFAAVFMWIAIASGQTRWDFYRYLGGDLQRRGESRAALSAYLRGERYAPAGQSRRATIKKLQRELGP